MCVSKSIHRDSQCSIQTDLRTRVLHSLQIAGLLTEERTRGVELVLRSRGEAADTSTRSGTERVARKRTNNPSVKSHIRHAYDLLTLFLL